MVGVHLLLADLPAMITPLQPAMPEPNDTCKLSDVALATWTLEGMLLQLESRLDNVRKRAFDSKSLFACPSQAHVFDNLGRHLTCYKCVVKPQKTQKGATKNIHGQNMICRHSKSPHVDVLRIEKPSQNQTSRYRCSTSPGHPGLI